MNQIELKENDFPDIFSYMDNGNPTLRSPSSEYELGMLQTKESLTDIDSYSRFIHNAISQFRHTRVYKNYKAYCVTFPKLDNYTILKYLTKKCEENGVAIEQEKLLTLIDNCNCDLGECLNEMDKIFTLEQANSNVLMDYMLNNGFSDYRQVNMFSLINKIISKDQKAFKDRLKSNDSPMSILMNLYSTAKKRLIETKNNEYAKYMTMCKDLCFGIVDGSVSDRSALSYLMLKLM